MRNDLGFYGGGTKEKFADLIRYVEMETLKKDLKEAIKGATMPLPPVIEKLRQTSRLWSYFSSTRRVLNQTASILSMNSQAEANIAPNSLYKPVNVDDADSLSAWLAHYADELAVYKKRPIGFWGKTHEEAIEESGLSSMLACEKARREGFLAGLPMTTKWSRLGYLGRQNPKDRERDTYAYLQSLDFAISHCQNPRLGADEKRSALRSLKLLLKEGLLLKQPEDEHPCWRFYQEMDNECPNLPNTVPQELGEHRALYLALCRDLTEQKQLIKEKSLHNLRRPFEHFDDNDIEILTTHLKSVFSDSFLFPIRQKIETLHEHGISHDAMILTETEVMHLRSSLMMRLPTEEKKMAAGKLNTLRPDEGFSEFYRNRRRASWYLGCRDTELESLWWPENTTGIQRALARVDDYRDSLRALLIQEIDAGEQQPDVRSPMPESLQMCLQMDSPSESTGITTETVLSWQRWLKTKHPSHPLINQLEIVLEDGHESYEIANRVLQRMRQITTDLSTAMAEQAAILSPPPEEMVVAQEETWVEKFKGFFGFKTNKPPVSLRSPRPLTLDEQFTERLNCHKQWLKQCLLSRGQYMAFFSFSTTQEIEKKYDELDKALARIQSSNLESLTLKDKMDLFCSLENWEDQRREYIAYFNESRALFFSDLPFWRSKLRCLGYTVRGTLEFEPTPVGIENLDPIGDIIKRGYFCYQNLDQKGSTRSRSDRLRSDEHFNLKKLKAEYKKLMLAYHPDKQRNPPSPLYFVLMSDNPSLSDSLSNPLNQSKRQADMERYLSHEQAQEKLFSCLEGEDAVAFIKIGKRFYYAIKCLRLLIDTRITSNTVVTDLIGSEEPLLSPLPEEEMTTLKSYHEVNYAQICSHSVNDAYKTIAESNRMISLSEAGLILSHENESMENYIDLDLKPNFTRDIDIGLPEEDGQGHYLCDPRRTYFHFSEGRIFYLIAPDNKKYYWAEFFSHDDSLLCGMRRAISENNLSYLTNAQKQVVLAMINAPGAHGIYLRINNGWVECQTKKRPVWARIEDSDIAAGPRSALYEATEREDLSQVDAQTKLNLIFKFEVLAPCVRLSHDLISCIEKDEIIQESQALIKGINDIQRERHEMKAKFEAEKAKRKAEKAKRKAEEAKLEAEKFEVFQAERAAQKAERAAEEAEREAEEAEREAEEAEREAEEAEREAEEAKREAEKAKREAEKNVYREGGSPVLFQAKPGLHQSEAERQAAEAEYKEEEEMLAIVAIMSQRVLEIRSKHAQAKAPMNEEMKSVYREKGSPVLFSPGRQSSTSLSPVLSPRVDHV